MTIKYPNGVASTNRHMKPRKVAKHKKRGTGPEQLIQRGIIEVLTMAGHHVWRINVGKVKMEDGRMFSAGPQAGFPDICGYRKQDGKMFFIEVKTMTGKRRPAQEYFAKEIACDPVIYGVARSAEEALMIVTKGLNRTEDIK
ncbi:VRR-NUC domain-containing protein [Lactiplantibacillus plantarum]|uniref:VRR-NUC domain-containing protein n=1 Tax=Lactiplantibacillus plantarum TaxID=1590 RepID=UPI000AFEDBAB|nr:VRR-NUC domain-containing protein [Lactiplantibacillus plantarum]